MNRPGSKSGSWETNRRSKWAGQPATGHQRLTMQEQVQGRQHEPITEALAGITAVDGAYNWKGDRRVAAAERVVVEVKPVGLGAESKDAI